MKQRGRKSTANLSVVPFAHPPVSAPADMADDERKIFDEIAATKPADYFTNENVGLLIELSRARARCDRLAGILNDAHKSAKMSAEELGRYLTMAEKQGRLVASLMTKLRLTPQSKYQAKDAARIPVAPPQQVRPWLANLTK